MELSQEELLKLMHRDMLDAYDEEFELGLDDRRETKSVAPELHPPPAGADPHSETQRAPIELPQRARNGGYERQPMLQEMCGPEVY